MLSAIKALVKDMVFISGSRFSLYSALSAQLPAWQRLCHAI
jgi:hypothetical protein